MARADRFAASRSARSTDRRANRVPELAPEVAPERGDLLQGTLDLLVLRILRSGPQHGYGIARRLRETSDQVILVEEGTLYPALHRLERRGFVESSWLLTETNRRAKFYRLTSAGKVRLETELASWSRLSGAIERVLATARAASATMRLPIARDAGAERTGAGRLAGAANGKELGVPS